MHEYLIQKAHAPHCYGGQVTFQARRTYGRPWHVICEWLSSDVTHYAVITAQSHTVAKTEAKNRWA